MYVQEKEIKTDPRSGLVRRHHIDPGAINKAIKSAVRKAGLTKRISAHSFRRSFATQYILYTRRMLYCRIALIQAIAALLALKHNSIPLGKVMNVDSNRATLVLI